MTARAGIGWGDVDFDDGAASFRGMSDPLADDAIADALEQLPLWRREGDALIATFRMRDFSEALGFIVRVGIEAERLNHHPEITNVWNRVTLRLTTHDAGNRITRRDLELAAAISRLFAGG